MTDTQDNQPFSFAFGAICKSCKRYFDFETADGLIDGVQFPKETLSLVTAKCPHCYSRFTYTHAEMIKPIDKENGQLKKQIEELKKQIVDKDQQIERLNNDLSKLATTLHAIMVRKQNIVEQSNEPASPNKSKSEENPSYRG